MAWTVATTDGDYDVSEPGPGGKVVIDVDDTALIEVSPNYFGGTDKWGADFMMLEMRTRGDFSQPIYGAFNREQAKRIVAAIEDMIRQADNG